MMKLLPVQNANRRHNNSRGASLLDGGVGGGGDSGGTKSSVSIFWMLANWFCCLISLLIGFRCSRLVFLVLSTSSTPFGAISTTTLTGLDSATPFSEILGRFTTVADSVGGANGTMFGAIHGSRVVVGRHGIRIRPWPHPNLEEVVRAHQILERVQQEQRAQYGVRESRVLIVVTPTYVRSFQTLHLTGVMHSLMNCPYKVVWVVVEVGGPTNETANLIGKSGIETIHVGFDQPIPMTWADRHRMEGRMRLSALRVVQERKLDGIIMFADDSNMHSMELFDEVQVVKWIGALSVGILIHTGDGNWPLPLVEDKAAQSPPVQGPSCNSSGALVGWHTFNSMPYLEMSPVYIGDTGVVTPMKLEWAGFVLNSKLLWKDDDVDDRPVWMKDLDLVNEEEVENPLSLVTDHSVVEPLGSCGRKVMVWWLRAEARYDSKFPSSWIIDPPLEITVPAKHTPWPDYPPELPAHLRMRERSVGEQQPQQQEKHNRRTRSPRPKHAKSNNKYKHEETRVGTDAQQASVTYTTGN